MATDTHQQRCAWVLPGDADYTRYHDREWGVPVSAERKLFEMLLLEGAQAGLSWITILRKRPHYRAVFDGFDAETIARYSARKLAALQRDPGIVRNRLKIAAAVQNARAWLALREQHGSVRDFLWQFVDGAPRQNRWQSLRQIPASSPESLAMSKTLKQHGFTFVGPTICYAFMQAVGMVNDHECGCFRHPQVAALAGKVNTARSARRTNAR